jgi:hypothetical protein
MFFQLTSVCYLIPSYLGPILVVPVLVSLGLTQETSGFDFAWGT